MADPKTTYEGLMEHRATGKWSSERRKKSSYPVAGALTLGGLELARQLISESTDPLDVLYAPLRVAGAGVLGGVGTMSAAYVAKRGAAGFPHIAPRVAAYGVRRGLPAVLPLSVLAAGAAHARNRRSKASSARNAALHVGLVKEAGVGWDLHGYHREHVTPELTAAKERYESLREREVGKYPSYVAKPKGAIGRLFRGKKYQKYLADKEAYGERASRFYDEHGLGPDTHGYRDDSRIKTPYDRQTSYKLNDRLTLGQGGDLAEDWYSRLSDGAYSDTPADRRLSKEELRSILADYKDAYARAVEEGHFAGEQDSAYANAFLAKGDALLNDPEFRYARLEME